MKTRPEKYTEDQMRDFLEIFINGRDGYGPISASQAATWLNTNLSPTPPLAYTDFTRKKAIKALIEEYNQRLAQRTANLFPQEGTEDSINIEETADPALLAELKKDLKTAKDMLKAAQTMAADKDAENTRLKSLNTELRKQNRSLRANVKKLNSYIDEYLYDEISRRHFSKIRLDDVGEEPHLAEEVVDALCPEGDDLSSSINGFYGDVISQEKADLLDAFGKL